MSDNPPQDLRDLYIYAWVGEDELGSGKIGIKQALTGAGMIPLAAMAYHVEKLARMLPAMEAQAIRYGKKIRLVQFRGTGVVVAETEHGE